MYNEKLLFYFNTPAKEYVLFSKIELSTGNISG